MTFLSVLPFAAAIFALLLALASLLRKKRSLATWLLFAGTALLGIDSLLSALTLYVTDWSELVRGLTLGLVVKSFATAAWLGFSLTYSRRDYRESLARLSIPLAMIALLPIVLALGFHDTLLKVVQAASAGDQFQLRLSAMGKLWNVVLLTAAVWILMNLEQTFRSAVGTMRWRIKFVVLGVAVIFGTHLYVRSQALLFSSYDMDWSGVESSALLIGCVFLVIAYVRTGLAEIDAYPSRAILGSSLTVLLVGGYFFIVGILAKIVRRFGGAESFQIEAFVVLLGISGLALLLLSDRLRQRIHKFIARHFARAQHDSVRIWTEFSRRLGNVKNQASLCTVSAKLVSETFEILSVTIWLRDDQREQFVVGASTAPEGCDLTADNPQAVSSAFSDALRVRSSPFDLERINEPWADELRQLNRTTFPNGGNRWCVPLLAGGQCLGALVLADRVNGAGYTHEELQLLQCIADQVTSVLLNLRLANEVARSKEMEAFRTMSAFFVHDLKNAAASLNLMLKNLPVHFDDPTFREDTLRGIGNTARRIDKMIAGLTTLRQGLAFNPVDADLNQLVRQVLQRLDGTPRVELTNELEPLPNIRADREQIQSVVTNLVLNARDALGVGGRIRVRTEHLGDSVVLTIVDNGCGMSAAFVKDSLFRPFQSTKKEGLGIGMFQSQMIVEAHGGSIRVKSEEGKGTTFRVSLPVKDVR
jgi:putative PEP-CTERM system histidine kinase